MNSTSSATSLSSLVLRVQQVTSLDTGIRETGNKERLKDSTCTEAKIQTVSPATGRREGGTAIALRQ